MTEIATLQRPSNSEVYLSYESAKTAEPVLRLLICGREMGFSTSLTETESTHWSMDTTERFHELAKSWRKDTRHLSSIQDMVLHPAYQQIIGMGPTVVPLIIKELQNSPDHWFWALRAITGEDPVPPSHRGNVRKIAHDWVRWYGKRGFMR